MKPATAGKIIWCIGRVSKATGVSVDAVRFYERTGLLRRAPRTAGGFRLYSAVDIATLHFIRRAQKLGFSVGEVRELLRLSADDVRACISVRELLREKVNLMRGKIRELRHMEHELAAALRRCERKLSGRRRDSAAVCPTLEKMEGQKRR